MVTKMVKALKMHSCLIEMIELLSIAIKEGNNLCTGAAGIRTECSVAGSGGYSLCQCPCNGSKIEVIL